MLFEITAYDAREGIVPVSVEAASYEEARILAHARGLEILSIRRRWHWFAQRRRRDLPFDVLLFSQELAALLAAGLSLVEALGVLSRKERAVSRRSLIDVLLRQLREGQPFSAALREFPAVFPPLYVALVAASEQTGDLAGSLDRYLAYRARLDAVRKRVAAALIYPALLLLVGAAVVLFLMGYVVPRFSHLYEDLGGEPPFLSGLLLRWGRFVEERGLLLFLLAAAAGAGLFLFLRSPRARQRALRRIGRLRLLRGLRERVHIHALARFYRTLGLLQREGLPIIPALGLARELLPEEGRLGLDHVAIEVRAGSPLSEAMERHHLAPPVASDLLRVGERTGGIGDKMLRIADLYDAEIARWSEWFLKLFEPLLMLTIGLFIAFIVVLLYFPIFELAGSLG